MEIEYKPFTRAELEEIRIANYLTFSTIAAEQFGKTERERLDGHNLAERNARVFALNMRGPLTYKERDKVMEDMMRRVLLEWYDASVEGVMEAINETWSDPSMMHARRTK
jgi:hypothetical protein